MTDEIRTERLLLRRVREEDAADLFEVFRDPRAMRYWSHLPHTHIDETRKWVGAMAGLPPGKADDFVIEHEGRVIGKAGCWLGAEVGILVHPAHWGRGIASEALTAVIPHCFATLDADRLTADTDPRNDAVHRLFRGLGFTESGFAERTILVGEEWCDSLYFELTRERWEAGG